MAKENIEKRPINPATRKPYTPEEYEILTQTLQKNNNISPKDHPSSSIGATLKVTTPSGHYGPKPPTR